MSAPAQAAAGGLTYASNPAELPEGTLVDLYFRAIDHRRPRAQLIRSEGGWQPISHERDRRECTVHRGCADRLGLRPRRPPRDTVRE
jgi:hypothetical protein